MGQAGRMEPPNRPAVHQADLGLPQPIALLARVKELRAVARAAKPLALFLFSLNAKEMMVDRAVLKKEMLLVGGDHNAQSPSLFYDTRWPAEEFLPVVSTLTFKCATPIGTHD